MLNLLQSNRLDDLYRKHADRTKQYGSLVGYLVTKRDYSQALEKLCQVEAAQERYALMTTYLSLLIKNEPKKTIEKLRDAELFKDIDVHPLMPALTNCPNSYIEQARAFVEEDCIGKRNSSKISVHNALAYLYVKSPPQHLITWLKAKV